jgi:hypothetical protein
MAFFISFVFIYYIAAMHIRKVIDQVGMGTKLIIFPAFAVGLILYAALNVTVGTLLFLQLPKSLQFTDRLKRNLEARDGSWRYKQAVWWCAHLEIFDEGHCE